LKNFVYFDKINTNSGGAPTSLARKIAAAKKEAAKARGEAPNEATNSIWWCLLDEIRTFFDENPDCEF